MLTISLIPLLVLGHLLTDLGRVREVGRIHRYLHTVYALAEPMILRVVDAMVESWLFGRTRPGRAVLWLLVYINKALPHGVVIPTSTAIHLLRDIEKYSNGQAHIAVGQCVCQWSLERWCEPIEKDLTIWYGSEIYTRHYPDKYRFIGADEAAELLRKFHDQGLVHVVEFCMQNRRWMFVICNCDREICVPARVYHHTGLTIYPGPYRCEHDNDKCVGTEACGACLTRCPFIANREEAGKALLIADKCLGCGLCVTTCAGQARRLTPRPGYKGRLLPREYLEGWSAGEAEPGSGVSS